MDSRKKKKLKRPIYDSVHKPTAPPTVKFGKDKPGEKVHPAIRKIKHKKDEDIDE